MGKEKNLFKMKGVFWNSKKHKFVSDLTKENGLSFIALLKMGRSEFMPRFLKNLCGGRDFLCHTKAPHGRSGGILLGVDQNIFDIGSIDEDDFYVTFQLCNKSDGFKPDHKESFLAELVCMCSHENLPLVMGGDYNILQHPSEKNNPNYNARWSFLFNAVIDGLNLRELEMSRRKFTWGNNLAQSTFEKLDRILITTE
jgi:hypothetical protein